MYPSHAGQDHIEAVLLRNTCRRAAIQVGTIDALLARLCLRHHLELLTTDQDFVRIAGRTPLRVWQPPRSRRRVKLTRLPVS
jgi:predicted nucleic acid-binding protein